MGASTRFYYARCSKCYERYWYNKLKSWSHYEFVRALDCGAVLRCLNCGHEWKSYGKAARALARKAAREEQDE